MGGVQGLGDCRYGAVPVFRFAVHDVPLRTHEGGAFARAVDAVYHIPLLCGLVVLLGGLQVRHVLAVGVPGIDIDEDLRSEEGGTCALRLRTG